MNIFIYDQSIIQCVERQFENENAIIAGELQGNSKRIF